MLNQIEEISDEKIVGLTAKCISSFFGSNQFRYEWGKVNCVCSTSKRIVTDFILDRIKFDHFFLTKIFKIVIFVLNSEF